MRAASTVVELEIVVYKWKPERLRTKLLEEN